MQRLQFPEYNFKTRLAGQSTQIFDSLRRKYVALTPEEWVRQHLISFLINEKKFPAGRMAVEMEIEVNRLKKRCDVVVYDKNFSPLMIIECKAASVKLQQEVFDQASRYNITLNVPYLLISNGLQHFSCKVNHEKKELFFMKEIPMYADL